jgi:hypothetical protein
MQLITRRKSFQFNTIIWKLLEKQRNVNFNDLTDSPKSGKKRRERERERERASTLTLKMQNQG